MLQQLTMLNFISMYIFPSSYLSLSVLSMEEASLHDIYERLLVAFYESIGHYSWGYVESERNGVM